MGALLERGKGEMVYAWGTAQINAYKADGYRVIETYKENPFDYDDVVITTYE